MKRIDIEIKGISPFFFGKPTEDKAPKTEEQKIKVAMNKVYCNGTLYAPGRVVNASMIRAISMLELKMGRSLQRPKDLVKNGVFVDPVEMHFLPAMTMEDIEIVKRWTGTGMGSGIWTKHAIINEWGLIFEMRYWPALEATYLKTALEGAGFLCGLGSRLGDGNGRFEIVSFVPRKEAI